MKEIKGELWHYYNGHHSQSGAPYVICITTNGFVKANGQAVMGRGCALEAKSRIPEFPALLAFHIKASGNVPMRVPGKPILTFPVKHNWWEEADPKLIRKSAEWLAACDPAYIYILPRPGCGNGRLKWEQIRPVIEFLPDNVWGISKG